MGKRTGNPRGRPPGAKNKRTIEREKAVAEAAAKIEKTLREPFTGDAHALLMSVYKDTEVPIELRIDAAKKAVHFEKPPSRQSRRMSQPTATKTPSLPLRPLSERKRETSLDLSP